MKVSVEIEMQDKQSTRPPKTLIEKAESLIRRLEDPSGDNKTEWEVIRAAYEKLCKIPKLSEDQKLLMELLENTVEKFRNMDPIKGSPLQHDTYRRWLDDEDEEESTDED